jgi:stage V sporulation protein AC
MKMTNKEYGEYIKRKSPNSPIFADMLRAFISGGIICCVGQGIMDAWEKLAGLSQENAGAATSITLVFIGALLTGLHVYDSLAKFAGAGTLVPITGFANSVVSPALEFKTEGFITGMAAKMFTIAGPVLVFGVAASVIYGLILALFGLA